MKRALRRFARGGRAVSRTPTERYWNRHTVNSQPFKTAEASDAYLEWRFEQYPLFREHAGLWGNHQGQRLLDYGCGPGNDVAGFLVHSGASHVVGADVSTKALGLAAQRLELYGIDRARYDLVAVSEADDQLPFDDAAFDHVNCGGVIHHTSNPASIVRELRRVLRERGTCTIMVYNRDSVYFHLYTAYMRQILEPTFAGMSVEEAFRRNTDGPECPVSIAYRHEEFLDLCRRAGLEGEFVGGYFLKDELEWLRLHHDEALAAPNLASEHKEFLRVLEEDEHRFPLFRGKHAGIGGVYHLRAA